MHPPPLSSVQVRVYVPAAAAVIEEVAELGLPKVIPAGPVQVPVPKDAVPVRL